MQSIRRVAIAAAVLLGASIAVPAAQAAGGPASPTPSPASTELGDVPQEILDLAPEPEVVPEGTLDTFGGDVNVEVIKIASLEEMAAAGIQCTNGITVDKATKSGTTITVKGSYSRCDNTFNQIKIAVWERSGIIGFQRGTWAGSAHLGAYYVHATASCKGHGTDKWYGVNTASLDGKQIDRKESAKTSFTC